LLEPSAQLVDFVTVSSEHYKDLQPHDHAQGLAWLVRELEAARALE
jgi:hypothetical protein